MMHVQTSSLKVRIAAFHDTKINYMKLSSTKCVYLTLSNVKIQNGLLELKYIPF